MPKQHPEQSRSQPAMRVPERSLAWTDVTVWEDGVIGTHSDSLSAEEPLEICLQQADGQPQVLAVTMRTPGHDLELAAGFLLTEDVLSEPAALRSVAMAAPDADLPPASARNRVVATVDDVPELPTERRRFVAGSGCGVCGKASIAALHHRCLQAPVSALRVTGDFLCELPDKLHAAQNIFARTGGLHAAALFDSRGQLLVLREDIGRHNAVDKVIGWSLLERHLPQQDCILLVSGRCGFEIAQKALAAGIPFLASISAPSTLAVQLAREFHLTLVGFLRQRRFVIYSGADRCLG